MKRRLAKVGFCLSSKLPYILKNKIRIDWTRTLASRLKRQTKEGQNANCGFKDGRNDGDAVRGTDADAIYLYKDFARHLR